MTLGVIVVCVLVVVLAVRVHAWGWPKRESDIREDAAVRARLLDADRELDRIIQSSFRRMLDEVGRKTE